METKYFVAETYRYKESGKWEYKIGMYDSVYEAKKGYHARKAAITKDSNDFVMVKAFDMYGNDILKPDYDVTHAGPTPNEEV